MQFTQQPRERLSAYPTSNSREILRYFGVSTWALDSQPGHPGFQRRRLDPQSFGRTARSSKFQVYADEEQRFDSGVIKTGEKARKIDVEIRGAKRLRLVVTDGGDGVTSDHADWADARLARAADESSPAENRPPKPAGEK